MKNLSSLLRVAVVCALLCILPMLCFAQPMSDMATVSYVFATIQIVIWLTSVVSIVQLIRPGETNRTPFHILNMILVVVFDIVALSYLISHKAFYVGYEHLTAGGCIYKYFVAFDIGSILKRGLEIGFICNVIYVIRFGKRYYINTNN